MCFSLVTTRASGAPDAALAASQLMVLSLSSRMATICNSKPCLTVLSLTHRLQRAPERLYCLPRARESAAELAPKLGARCLSGVQLELVSAEKDLKAEPAAAVLSASSKAKAEQLAQQSKGTE